MSVDDLLLPLSHVPLLAGLHMAQLGEMARRGEKLRYSAGDALMKTGQAGDGAFLILSGAVDRIGGSEAGMAERIAPGSLLAEMAMFVEHTYEATCVARERVYCLKLTRAAVHAQMLGDASLIEHFQRRITEKVRHVAEELRKMDAAAAATPAKTAVAPPPQQPAKSEAQPQRFVAAPRAWR